MPADLLARIVNAQTAKSREQADDPCEEARKFAGSRLGRLLGA